MYTTVLDIGGQAKCSIDKYQGRGSNGEGLGSCVAYNILALFGGEFLALMIETWQLFIFPCKFLSAAIGQRPRN